MSEDRLRGLLKSSTMSDLGQMFFALGEAMELVDNHYANLPNALSADTQLTDRVVEAMTALQMLRSYVVELGVVHGELSWPTT